MKHIYLAGPYTLGDPAVNTGNMIKAYSELIDLGYYPLCPLFSHFSHMFDPKPYETWLEWDLAWLPKCDALLRLSGESKGADIEEAKARELGIPVFYSIEELT